MRFLLTLLIIPALSMAQTNQTLTPEKLWEIKRVSGPQVSPDGKTVLYGVKSYDIKTNKGANEIWSANIKTGESKLILPASVNANSARFRPDGKALTYLANSNGEMQLFECDLSGLGSTQITNIKGGISGYKYAPALNYIAFSANVKLDLNATEVYPDLDKTTGRVIDGLFYRHWDNWSDYTYSHLFIQAYANGKVLAEPKDIMEGEKFSCPNPPHGDDDEFNWNASGNLIAYNCKKLTGTDAATSTNTDIYVYNLVTKATVNLSRRNLGYDRNPKFSPDGSKLAWLQMERAGNEADRNTLVVYDFNAVKQNSQNGIKATVEPIKQLTANFDYSLDQFDWVDNERVLFTAVVEATKQIFLFDPKLRSASQTIAVTQGIHDYSEFSFSTNGKSIVLVGSKMSMSMPSELFVIDQALTKNSERQLTFTNKNVLGSIPMGRVEKRWITTSDNKKMLTWVIYPPNFDATKKYPTLLYCQGGPQSPVSQFFSYRWNFQLMAANGYIVVAPNRRGLPGFGSEWNDEIIGDYGGQCMRDYLSAIDEVAKEPFVNKEKLGAVGASFGGFSVYWLAGNHQKRFKTFVAHCGMFNMESWFGSTEEMFFALNDNEGPYWNQAKKPNNFDASPHKFVQNWDTPILIIHNEKDYRVPVTQGMEAFTAAQLKGIKSKFLYFPDENHWMLKPQNSILWQRTFFNWLKETLNN